jgi:hypothetical protein
MMFPGGGSWGRGNAGNGSMALPENFRFNVGFNQGNRGLSFNAGNDQDQDSEIEELLRLLRGEPMPARINPIPRSDSNPVRVGGNPAAYRLAPLMPQIPGIASRMM